MTGSQSHILVLGSLNNDLVLQSPRMPAPGETLACVGSAQFCGGKGANQAVACARLGASVAMIGRVGDDPAGLLLRNTLEHEGILQNGVITTPGSASGQAVVILTPDGQNRILLVAGANDLLCPGDVEVHAAGFDDAGLLICQLEVPTDTVEAAIRTAACQRIPVLLNPAPAKPLGPDTLGMVDYLVPNESEAEILSGITIDSPETAAEAALLLHQWGARHVIITLGAAGIMIADDDGCRRLAAKPATVIDTTAAGDSFIGGLATGLIEGLPLDQAAHLGLRAAAICVGRQGAQAALPRRQEL